MEFTYQKKYSLEKRLQESRRIRNKYPNRIPIIIERDSRSKDVPQIDKKKYLVPDDLILGQFMFIIRKRVKLSSYKSIYLFINNSVLLSFNQLMINLYNSYKSEDGFLYIKYAGENTFG